MSGELLVAVVQTLLPKALEQLHTRPAAEVAAVAEKAVREYVPKRADRARLVAIVKEIVRLLEETP